MKKISTLIQIIILIIPTQVLSQELIFNWGNSTGGIGYDVVTSLISDDSGYVYATGVFEGIVDFDPGPETFNLYSNGQSDIFIQKLDSVGNFIWAQSIGGTHADTHSSISFDSNNNLFVTGAFSYDVDFNNSSEFNILSSNGATDVFILKLDLDGNFIWVKSIGGINGDYPKGFTLDNSDNLILNGIFSDIVDFDPSSEEFLISSELGIWAAFILKLSADNADFVWAKSIEPSVAAGNINASSIVADNNNDIYASGFYFKTADFDPGDNVDYETANGEADIYLLKLDPNGQRLWSKTIGGIAMDVSKSISVDNANNLIVLGEYSDTVNFSSELDPQFLIATSGRDAFVVKYNPEGELIWLNNISGNGYISTQSIDTDQLNNSYITATFTGSHIFEIENNEFQLSTLNQDILIAKLDESGNFLWVNSIGGDFENGGNIGQSIFVDNSYNILLAGHFVQTVDFDLSGDEQLLTSNGLTDSFIAKWKQDFSNSISFLSDEFDITYFPNPTIDFIEILKSSPQELQLELVDISGNIVLTKNLIQKNTKINLSEINAGLYFLIFKDKNYVDIRTIIKIN